MKKDKKENFYLGKKVSAYGIYSIKKFNERLIASYKKNDGRYFDGLVEGLIDANRDIKNVLKADLYV